MRDKKISTVIATDRTSGTDDQYSHHIVHIRELIFILFISHQVC